MYRIVRTKVFERSYKRLKQSGIKKQVIDGLKNIIDTLALGKTLASKHRDHKLTGYFSGYRECHVRPNLLLVYQIDRGNLILVLVDIGSHPYLFG
ncbi:MAG: type II toxin-antitoxin system YafQ family toxin [Candidatus Wildermuthbacteria bacterium]|nr:type II toxin-antitoxin system YafQ family toxin [Candidatus Wildermuthbacteria bacterium]